MHGKPSKSELKSIIAGCVRENEQSQRLLFGLYANRMMTLCLRYTNFRKQDAEDILQEGFIRIYDKIALYKDFGSFEGWMKRVFINIALRKNQNLKKIADISVNLQPHIDSIQLPSIINTLEAEELLQTINTLPEGYRIVFNLFVIDGYSHDEIAGILGIKSATSRSQLTKAKQLLRKIITKKHPQLTPNFHTTQI